MSKKQKIESNFRIVSRAGRVLTGSEKTKVIAVVGIQIFLNLLDLVGVAVIGVLGALTISGVGSRQPGNRVNYFLDLINLENFSLQRQALILGSFAAFVLAIKTASSIFLFHKVTFFLSRRSAAISSRLLKKLLNQPISKLQKRSMQETLYLINSGVDSITMGILTATIQIISDSSLLLILLIGLFIVDPGIALITVFIFAGVAWLLYRFLEVKSVNLGISEANLSILHNEKTLEVLNCYREIVVKNRRDFYANEIGALRFQASDNAASRAFLPNISKYIMELTLVLACLLISALQFLLNDSTHAVAVLSIFLASSARIAPAVLRIQQSSLSIKARIGSAEPALTLIEELADVIEVEKIDEAVRYSHPGFVANISVKGVSFSYPDSDSQAVSDINFDIYPGQMVAIVGPSGSGKTTLVDLMLGILEPSFGAIKINGLHPIECISNWPGAIGYVPQDVVLSNNSIEQNICMGYSRIEISNSAIMEAIDLAHLNDFLESLPSGLKTQVGDNGSKVSGGQKQRIGIARALLTSPKLLILDEATSSLDGEAESNITKSLLVLKGRVTIVMIAHRLSTVRAAEKVIYMERGTIVAQGSFDEVRNKVPNFDKQAALMGL